MEKLHVINAFTPKQLRTARRWSRSDQGRKKLREMFHSHWLSWQKGERLVELGVTSPELERSMDNVASNMIVLAKLLEGEIEA